MNEKLLFINNKLRILHLILYYWSEPEPPILEAAPAPAPPKKGRLRLRNTAFPALVPSQLWGGGL